MPDKPKVTDDHLKKYESIMGTPVASKSSPTPAPTTSTERKSESKWTKSSFISSLPKPSDLSNKMFIFTGKKKIVIDGNEKEVENVKTVNPAMDNKKVTDAVVAPPPPKETPEPAKAPTITITKEKPKEEKKVEKETPKKASTSGESKKIPMPLIVASFAIFLGAWTLFWLVFFGYIQL